LEMAMMYCTHCSLVSITPSSAETRSAARWKPRSKPWRVTTQRRRLHQIYNDLYGSLNMGYTAIAHWYPSQNGRFWCRYQSSIWISMFFFAPIDIYNHIYNHIYIIYGSIWAFLPLFGYL
jgi:hypothetical protein